MITHLRMLMDKFFNFYFLAIPNSMQNLSSLTRDWIQVPCRRPENLNHWTTREVPWWMILMTLLDTTAERICFPRRKQKKLSKLYSGKTKWLKSSGQFSFSVMSNSLQPHGLQHARPPCLSPIHGVYSSSCPLSRWCHPTLSSSVIPFFSSLQSFPASGSFQMSQFFISGAQSIGVSASASFLPMNIQDQSPLGWTGWMSLQSKGLSRVISNPQFKSINSLLLSFLYSPTLTSIHDHWKNLSLD